MDFKTDLNDRERKRFAEYAHILIDLLNQFHDEILAGEDQAMATDLAVFVLTGKAFIDDLAPVVEAAAMRVRVMEGELKDANWDQGLAGLLDEMDKKKGHGGNL